MGFMKSKLVIVLGLLGLATAGYAAYALVVKDDSAPTKQPAIVTRKSSSQDKVKVTTTTDTSPKSRSGDDTKANLEPIAPSGTFVSNHRPNLDGNPAPNSMNSICRTTPGINCEIRFTKDGVTKTLGPDTVGQDGLISWDWKLQDVGLTEGSWQITAVASYGSKTVQTTDSIALEVGP